MGRRPKVCIIVSIEMIINAFMLNHIRTLEKHYDIYIVLNTQDVLFLRDKKVNATIIPLSIQRKISPYQDLIVLFKLLKILKKNKFDIIHSVTPKAGLLSTISGKLAGVRFRIHTFTGQVWVSKRGSMKRLLKLMDKCIAKLATHIIVDSPSQKKFLISENVISENKALVLGRGSISGVDLNRFKLNSVIRQSIRDDYGFSEEEFVILFLGRVTLDKGIFDLIEAYKRLRTKFTHIRLMVVGPDEENLVEHLIKQYNLDQQVKFIGYTDFPEQYMMASDLLCLPSYREGFGNVIIEAAAVSIPAVGSNIYGISDAIEEQNTGLLFEPGNIEDLVDKLEILITNPELRENMGQNARRRVEAHFSKEAITLQLLNFYKEQLT